ncbi:MAG: RNA polymerase sporulation sigma factor SigH [Lachnospiraceae bacterium]|nr:RNA polymerase sporulation sigma factor SigH [Lachnospiraceae bacterium]
MNFEQYTDEKLIAFIHNGNQEATEYLLKKYSPLVKKSIRTLYLIGADTEDLSQEGMIGLFKAIQNYEESSTASFYTFAKLCIDRQIYSAIKASNRKKHSPLNSYISFYSRNNEDDSELINNLEAGNDSNPEHIVLDRENTSHIESLLDKNLSKMEKEILPLYLDGLSYSDIASFLNKPVKSVDNAVQRIREKVKKLYIHP